MPSVIASSYLLMDCMLEFRFRSICLIVSFQNPPIGPKNASERKLRAELDTAIMDSRYSSAMGWIVSSGQGLRNDLQVVQQMEAELQESSLTKNSRQCCGWALLLYFTNKVKPLGDLGDGVAC